MNSNTTRVVAGIVIVVVAVVLFAVLRDDSESASEKSDKASEPAGKTTAKKDNAERGSEITTIVIKDGKPVGGIAQLTYNEGEQVRFEVDSDVSDEIHMHGYDIMKDVEAGGSVTFDFPATIEGIFEAELEGRGEQILELTVNP
jgi:heme/copper-type cytochrome/quinol oxidase subunit 2